MVENGGMKHVDRFLLALVRGNASSDVGGSGVGREV